MNVAGVSLNILTGRSSNFQMTPIKSSGEIQEINLQSDFEKTYKFCLVRRETGLAGQKKEYQGDVYSLDVGQEQERRVEIVRTPAGVQVAWIRGKEADLEVLSPVVAGKIYSERERVTGKNWSAWLESRHQFKREGPIFLSFTRTRGEPTVTELREELEGLVRGKIIRSI